MRLVTWLLRLFFFVLALWFALSNHRITEVGLFGVEGLSWRAPLVVFLLGFLAVGFVLGVFGVLPTLFRQRRELGRLRRELKAMSPAPATAPPLPHAPLPPGGALGA